MPRTARPPTSARPSRLGPIVIAIVISLGVGVAGIAGSAAALDCASANVTAAVVADTWIDQNSPTSGKGSDSVLSVDAGSVNIDTGEVSGRTRALVRFSMPTVIPEGCVVESAWLRMYASEEQIGTRVEALRLASAWSESDTNWNNQPQTLGTAVAIWSRDGYMQWTVSDQVQAMLTAGVYHGFLLRDAAEGAEVGGGGHGFYGREKGEAGTAPELVIRFARPPSDEPPGPPEAPVPAAVSCGQVIERSILLTNGLSECPGDGLVIGAPRIVIDLGGHTVDGVGLGVGVRNDGFPSVTVRNGTIRQFDYGVQLAPETVDGVMQGLALIDNQVAAVELFDVARAEVRDNTLDLNGGGIMLVSGTRDSVVAGNTITGNGGAGVLLRDATGNRIEDNRVSGGGDLGIGLERASGNVLVGNTSAGNSDGGIELRGASHGNRLEGNTVTDSGDHGILISQSDRSVLIGNIAHFMSDSGITLDTANDGVLRANDVRFNTGGLQLDGASRNLIEGNDASETSGIGIELGGGSLGNLLEGNVANANKSQGIYVGDEALDESNVVDSALGNVFVGNTANGNGADGIAAPKAGHTLTANTARNNKGWGIYAALVGTTDSGLNVASGNEKPEQCQGVVCKEDWTPPETHLTDHPAPFTRSTSATFRFTGTDDWSPVSALTFACSLDGGAYVTCTSPWAYASVADGPHTFAVRATDRDGNTDPSPATFTWTVDGTPPETTITQAPADPSDEADAQLRFVGSDNATDAVDLAFECRLDGAPAWIACTNPQDLTGLVESNHSFAVRATDGAGNVDATPATWSWKVDLTAPLTTVSDGPADPTGAASATFHFSATEPATFACTLDAVEPAPCASPATYEALDEGSHTFTVRATDAAGNLEAAPVTVTWRIDRTPPATSVDLGPAPLTSATSASFAFAADEQAAFECSLDDAAFTPCSSPTGYEDLGEGAHTFAVRATDAAGNTDESPARHLWTIDTTPPESAIAGGPADPTNDRDAELTFSGSDETSEATALSFECRLNGGEWVGCSSPQTRTDLPEGSHTFAVRATDGAGNTDASPATYVWTIDLIAPETTVDSGPRDPTNAAEATFAFSADEAATFACALDDMPFAPCTSPATYAGVGEGSHSFAVRATDTAGNTDDSQATHVWTIDLTPPDTTIDGAPDDPTNDTDATFAFSADEAASFACSLDGADFTECTSPQSYAGLGEGSHSFAVRATDRAGNVDESPATASWTIDLTAPTTTIDSRPDTLTTSTSATFTFSADEATTFACSLDGADFTDCTSPAEYIALVEGWHKFEVRATDRAGNVDSPGATYAWLVDATPPRTAIDGGPDDPSNDHSATFAFSADEAASFACSLDGADAVSCTSPHSYADLGGGDHTFTVRATDAAGNRDDSPATYAWTIDMSAPETALEDGPDTPTASTSASFAFAADEAATFGCSLDGAALSSCASPVSYTGLAEGSHTFAVVATDEAGNRDGSPATYAWRVDTTAPQTSIDSGPDDPSGTTDATFTFSADETATFACSLDGAGFTTCTSPTVITGLTDGPHTFGVSAADPAGNQNASPATYAWTVQSGPDDTEPPETSIEAMPDALTSATTAAFWFSANEPASFECALDGAPLTACSSPAAYAGLADGNHRFEVLATDHAGNPEATPAMYVWTIDTSTPETTIGGGPSGPTNSTSATFTFSADEPATLACSLDGGAFAACSSPRQLTGLATGTHTFRVRATDDAGNTDGSPATRTWTVDTAAPNTSITSGPTGTVTARSASFNFSATEAGSAFECSLDGSPFTACTTPQQYSGLSIGGHTFRARAIDPAGNTDLTPAARSWTIAGDSAPPNTTITGGPSGTVNVTTATFTFSSNEAGSTFQCSLDASAFAACFSPHTYTGLSGGTHTYRVRAIDGAGNVDGTPATRTWTVEIITGCGPAITVTASADAWLEQNSPSSNRGTDSILKVKSQGGTDNFRAVVRFELPTLPAGCVVDSATLRLFAASSVSGRSLQALRLGTTWTESGVTWANQPAITGAAAITTSGTGYREWNVKDQLQAMFGLGANHGFLIRDAVEGGPGVEQSFHARDKGQSPPQLVIRLIEGPSSAVNADTALTEVEPGGLTTPL